MSHVILLEVVLGYSTTYCYCYSTSSRTVIQNRLFMSHVDSAVRIAYWTANGVAAGVCSSIMRECERIVAFVVYVIWIRDIMW